MHTTSSAEFGKESATAIRSLSPDEPDEKPKVLGAAAAQDTGEEYVTQLAPRPARSVHVSIGRCRARARRLTPWAPFFRATGTSGSNLK